jgi:hypothetical protein
MHAQAYGVLGQGGLDQQRHSLLGLYHRALARGRRGRLWSWLIGRSRRLLDLNEIEARCRPSVRSYAGQRVVPVEQIRGSAGRTSDFDREFCPLQTHTQERWLGIAAARWRGKTLPPVSLAQVGDLYFVLDGHHRISVARTLGEQYIEAQVTIWQVDGPLPWKCPTASRGFAPQPA